MRHLAAWLPLLPLLACTPDKKWDWREHFFVECMVLPELGEVSVHGNDLPADTVVSSTELPELGDTINRSGVYMTRASIVPLPPGVQTINFQAKHGDETASTSCSITRPVLAAAAKPVGSETKPFERALVTYHAVVHGDASPAGEPELLANVVELDDQRRYLLPFQAWQPQNIKAGADALTADERGVFRVPLPAESDKPLMLSFDNPDKQSVSYMITLVEAKPWAPDDKPELRDGAEHGWAWASALPSPRPPDKIVNALLLDRQAEPLSWTGTMMVLSEVERVASMTVTEETLEVCDYATPEGLTAKITRVAEKAEVILREATTGTVVARGTMSGKPDKCPDAADFTFVTTEGKDDTTGFDQIIVGEVQPLADAWFEKHAQTK